MRRALAAALLVACACSRPVDHRDGANGEVVDAPVVAFLSMARARHHEANVHEASGDAIQASEALRALVAAPRPHPGSRVPEVDEVLADTYARLAELDLARGDRARANRDVEDGLKLATEPTFFRGRLLEVAGIVEEANGNVLADAGQSEAAKQARAKAVDHLRQAVDIQEKVVQQRTSEAGP